MVGTDGTAYINSRSDRGISRDGSGQLGINPATAEEVAAGEESYKPVTPATLKPYIEAIYSTPAAYPKPGKAVYVGTWQGDKSVWRLAVDYTVSDLDISEGYTQDAAAKLGEYFVSAPAPALNIGGYIEYTYEGAAYYVGMSRVWQYDVSLNEYVKSGAVAHLMYDFVAEKSDFKDGVADN